MASSGTIDDEEEGGEWITMSNLDKHLTTQSQAVEVKQDKKSLDVKIVTSDFAM